MNPSKEYLALKALEKPSKSSVGDVWICRRLGIVKVMNGHSKGTRRGMRLNSFHLYHWGKNSLYAHPCDWRDNDAASYVADPACDDTHERWDYVGNIFEMLTYEALAGHKWRGANRDN